MTHHNNPPDNLRTFKVFTIEAGTVIDHIDAGHAIKIIQILDLAIDNKVVTTGLNFKSNSLGYKDIIKVEGRELTQEEINRIAIFAPHSTINIIRDYVVAKKFKAEMPETIEKLIICPNPKCITNHEDMLSFFYLKQNGKGPHLKCKYCEKIFSREDIREYRH